MVANPKRRIILTLRSKEFQLSTSKIVSQITDANILAA